MLIKYDWMNGPVISEGRTEEWWELVMQAHIENPERVFSVGTEVMMQRARVARAEGEIDSLYIILGTGVNAATYGFNDKGNPMAANDFWKNCPCLYSEYITRIVKAKYPTTTTLP